MQTTGERIQSRINEMGISQAELARRSGVSQSGLNFLINGKIKKPTGLGEIADALNVSVDWLMGRDETKPGKVIRVHDADKTPMGRPRTNHVSMSIPIKSTAAAELTKNNKLANAYIGKINWPPSMNGLEGLYAIYVNNNTMAPAFNVKDMALVSPHLPYGEGDIVVVREKNNPDSVEEMTVRAYAGQRDGDTIFKQLNPPLEVKIPTKNIFQIHKVLSQREIIGG
ncbi:MAG: LexA family transcriptional regulator [Rhizobiales bacterium]|nr:LexA family transcriptional regulator [Hyphomicrobiales bacterium]NRB13064.1 LexA family transcriptional regulator [Hyphomicrobiales bacterium]